MDYDYLWVNDKWLVCHWKSNSRPVMITKSINSEKGVLYGWCSKRS